MSDVCPEDSPSSSTGIVGPDLEGAGGGSTANKDDASLSQFESQSVVSGDKVKFLL